MIHRLRLQRLHPRILGPVLALALVAGAGTAIVSVAADGSPAAASGNGPTLDLRAGQTLEGTVPVNAGPTVEDDSVVSITVDGVTVDAGKTAGTARLSFDMGGNGTEARYHNYVVVNGHTADAERIFFPDVVGGTRGTLEFPGSWLQAGANTVTVKAGANWVDTTNATAVGVETLPYGEGLRCPNYDDFALSSIGLGLLGVVADGEQNAFSYSFGDGTCGSSKRLLSQPLTFVVSGEPGSTAGLRADLDTTKLSNGSHTVAATTESGRGPASPSRSTTPRRGGEGDAGRRRARARYAAGHRGAADRQR
ncbi:hypothetical protein ACFQZ4_19160 [Catellatospora coxensis]